MTDYVQSILRLTKISIYRYLQKQNVHTAYEDYC